MNFYPILWEEWITWKERFILYLGMYMMSPLLLLITFGWGSGNTEYLKFLLPGVMAFSALLNCSTGVCNRILSAKLSLNTYEVFLMAPVTGFSLTFGFVFSGALRGFFAVSLILLVGLVLGIELVLSLNFFLVLFLLCLVFTAFGVTIAYWAKDYEDSHYVFDLFILPMSFLGGTFVEVGKLPAPLGYLTWLLPLTPGSSLLRSLAHGQGFQWLSFLLLLAWLVLFFLLAQYFLFKNSQE